MARNAIAFAVEQKADIINLSWDLGIGSVAVEQAIQNACDAGALVVIAAGNLRERQRSLPDDPGLLQERAPGADHHGDGDGPIRREGVVLELRRQKPWISPRRCVAV
jgi:hypothetical protein